MALGSVTGVAISVALIVDVASLAYSDQVSSDIPTNSYVEKVLDISDARKIMAESLSGVGGCPPLSLTSWIHLL